MNPNGFSTGTGLPPCARTSFSPYVYYVQSNVDQQTKAVSNVLVKRGREWHGPDRMILNAKSIVFVEPVGGDSKVAQLIADSKK